MSHANHPNEKVSNFIKTSLEKIGGMELVDCKSKESIVLDEKETSYEYLFKNPNSSINTTLVLSQPLYFCDVIFSKGKQNYFPLKSYLQNVVDSNEIEDLFNEFIDEKISAEEYVLGYLGIFKKYAQTNEVQKIITGESWPDVPCED